MPPACGKGLLCKSPNSHCVGPIRCCAFYSLGKICICFLLYPIPELHPRRFHTGIEAGKFSWLCWFPRASEAVPHALTKHGALTHHGRNAGVKLRIQSCRGRKCTSPAQLLRLVAVRAGATNTWGHSRHGFRCTAGLESRTRHSNKPATPVNCALSAQCVGTYRVPRWSPVVVTCGTTYKGSASIASAHMRTGALV